MSHNNVVDFPKKENREEIEVNPKELKIAITSTLMLILALAVGINASVFSPIPSDVAVTNNGGGRGIASVPDNDGVEWNIRYRKNLSDIEKQDVQTGNKPTMLEELTFGRLKGRYTVDDEQGIVRNIKLSDANNIALGAAFIHDSEDFVVKYARLFSKKSASVQLMEESTVDGRKVELYTIYDNRGKEVADLNLVRDQENRFYELAVK